MRSVILTVLLINSINATITSYKFESVNFDSKIEWTGDGLYNISLKKLWNQDVAAYVYKCTRRNIRRIRISKE